ncbi:TWiK family of potassium channels protein 18-like isoform X2 [Vespula squamosa]|uniref:TWiK family of potassium channels protein 18-like isoform X2 n=1 Tax=Vespula squamosa TaxID=30214 RepID=A0ABD2C6B5_VESSQ
MEISSGYPVLSTGLGPHLESKPNSTMEEVPVIQDCQNKKKKRSPCPRCRHPDNTRPGSLVTGNSWPTRRVLP